MEISRCNLFNDNIQSFMCLINRFRYQQTANDARCLNSIRRENIRFLTKLSRIQNSKAESKQTKKKTTKNLNCCHMHLIELFIISE